MSNHILQSLKQKLTVEQAEALHMVSNPRLGDKPVPFGFVNHRWLLLLSQMQADDELWEYSFYGGPLCAEAGVALLRSGEVIAVVRTSIS